MEQQTVTLIVGALGIGGTLGGAIGGHFLTRSWQHKQWKRDKRLQDYQDVLSAITTAYMALIRLERIPRTRSRSLDDLPDIEGATAQSFRVLRDRIFIADELEQYRVIDDWDAAVTNYEASFQNLGDGEGKVFGLRFNLLNSQLVRMALQTPKGPGRFQRWRNRRAIAKYMAEKIAPIDRLP